MLILALTITIMMLMLMVKMMGVKKLIMFFKILVEVMMHENAINPKLTSNQNAALSLLCIKVYIWMQCNICKIAVRVV